MTPRGFLLKTREEASVMFHENDEDGIVDFCVNFKGIFLGNEKNGTCCYCMYYAFKGIENDLTLAGSNPYTCTRIIGVQVN